MSRMMRFVKAVWSKTSADIPAFPSGIDYPDIICGIYDDGEGIYHEYEYEEKEGMDELWFRDAYRLKLKVLAVELPRLIEQTGTRAPAAQLVELIDKLKTLVTAKDFDSMQDTDGSIRLWLDK